MTSLPEHREPWNAHVPRRSVLLAGGLAGVAAAGVACSSPSSVKTGPVSAGTDDLFPGFETRSLPTSRGELHARVGGSGPPVLLLHGYPETHLMWHAVAPLLAQGFTVVATDLPGYGDSFKPPASTDHVNHSKRAMAVDHVEAMASLGHDRFPVVGHDRGGRVGYRFALDHPKVVSRLAVLDIIPTGEVWRRAEQNFARSYWHWGFLALAAPVPERLISGDPDAFFEAFTRVGFGVDPQVYPEAVKRAYRAQLDSAQVVEAHCEDYRAGATINVTHDEADREEGWRIECPLLTLWGGKGALPKFYGDVLAVWKEWADDVSGSVVDTGHYLPEEKPTEVAELLRKFLSA